MNRLPLSSREATTFLALPSATRLICIERIHHCIELLYSLPEGASRNDCINVLDQHLWAIFAAHYDKPVSPLKPRRESASVAMTQPKLTLQLKFGKK
jgi:hypothetical protein